MFAFKKKQLIGFIFKKLIYIGERKKINFFLLLLKKKKKKKKKKNFFLKKKKKIMKVAYLKRVHKLAKEVETIKDLVDQI
jgi:hypothetical protein